MQRTAEDKNQKAADSGKPADVLRAQAVVNRTRTQQALKESGKKLFRKPRK